MICGGGRHRCRVSVSGADTGEAEWAGNTHLAQLAHLLAEAADAGKSGTAGVLEAHFVYHRVDLSWEDAHDGEGGHVEADACPGLEFVCGKSGSVGDDVAWARRSFHDDWRWRSVRARRC
jgi:hypothetical protein